MSQLDDQFGDDCSAIIKFEGVPKAESAPQETAKWRRFLRAIAPFTRKGGKWASWAADLGQEFAQAKVQRESAITAKLAAEAAEIAAQSDHKRQESLGIFNEAVDAIFADPKLPEGAKILKLAKLFELNPNLKEQIETIQVMLKNLRIMNGATVSFQSMEARIENDNDDDDDDDDEEGEQGEVAGRHGWPIGL